MAGLANPFTAYSDGPGLTELLWLYVCSLAFRPAFIVKDDRK
jgi:hypothetical protein